MPRASQHNHSLKAFFLVGPTAVGKSSVAHYLAEREGYDILSADSMLVYEGMDIGTDKPSREDRARVRYYGLDLVTPDCPFNAGCFRRYALEALQTAAREGRRMIVVGGTGLYIKCLTDGMNPMPPSTPEGRARWEGVLASDGLGALQQALQHDAPALFDALDDKQNARRLVRALECAAAGVREAPSSWRSAANPMLTGLVCPTEDLKTRIESRVHDMYRRGLLDEVRGLLSRWPDLSPTARQAIGYAEARGVIEEQIDLQTAIATTAARTRRLAKRQRTWFRTQANVSWVEGGTGQSTADQAQRVLAEWGKHGPVAIAC